MRAAALVLLLAVAGLLLGSGSAAAHAMLESTNPVQGSVVQAMPSRIELTFGEPVQVSADSVRVIAPDGSTVDTGRAEHPEGHGETVGVPMSGAAEGTYTVSWHVVSADSHPISGAFTFSLGHTSTPASAPPAAQQSDSAVSLLYGLTRALGYAAFALLAGSAAFVYLCWPQGAVRRTVRRLIGGAWLGLLLTTIASALLQGPYGAGLGLDHLFDGELFSSTMDIELGVGLAVRVCLLALAAPYLGELLATVDWTPARRALVGAGGVVLLNGFAWTWAGSGHAIAGLQPEFALPVDLLHLDAMAVWLGGLAVLAVVLWRGRELPESMALAVLRFSKIAFGCVVVLVATGTYQSWRQLGSWQGFTDTGYGRLLLVKVLGVAAVLVAAWYSRRWVRGQGRIRLRRSVLAEALGAVLVIGLTGFLVSAEPARTALADTPRRQATPSAQTVPFDTGGPHGRGQLRINALPLRPGTNLVDVLVVDETGTPTDVAELTATLSLPERGLGPLKIDMAHQGRGGYRAGTAEIPLAGDWQLAVTVRTSDVDQTTVTARLLVSGTGEGG
ncbi:copper resistance protein CopC [Kutzneria viridogrisea]|uniref:Copper transport protein n=1 Tax=Kutzneria viridogrisea TaxID=47990 RepID=A0ABR6BJQ9_9PSEU|nr:copper transport protein [Kutzneria viridogrisea]